MSGGEGEENRMENKSTARQSSVPPKSNGAESKKDNGNGKGRNRRKDYGGGGNGGGGRGNKAEGHLGQPPAQKSRGYDKRPRQRGRCSGYQRQEVVKMTPESDFDLTLDWGQKKKNLNHLLNFHFEERDQRGDVGRPGGGRYKRSSRFNKEVFLQANCRFMVCQDGSYEKHLVDQDVLVDWDLIEQVIVYSYEDVSCPICLYPPTAPKVTRCGHVYCWSCMLHYLSLEEGSYRKCPICYDLVQVTDLKSVRIEVVHQYRVGDVITLQLMRKPRKSMVAEPVCQEDKPQSPAGGDMRFSKLVLASPQQVDDIIQCESTALHTQLALQETDSLESSFIVAAMKQLQERARDSGRVVVIPDKTQDALIDVEQPQVTPPTTMTTIGTETALSVPGGEEEVACSDGGDDILATSASMAETDIKKTTQEKPKLTKAIPTMQREQERRQQERKRQQDPMTSTETEPDAAAAAGLRTSDGGTAPQGNADKELTADKYFYQAADGQHVYLHSLNVRCLVKEYGGLEHCPSTITANIVSIRPFTMTEDVRYHRRFLAHLPLHCEYQVAELALRPPLICSSTLNLFADEIDERKKLRQRKMKEEKRRDRRIADAENRKFGIDPTVLVVRSQTIMTEPIYVPSGQSSVEAQQLSSSGSPPPGVVSPCSPGSTCSDDSAPPTAVSFAKMLRDGKCRAAPSSPHFPGSPDEDTQQVDNPDYSPSVPTYQTSFGDAIQTALDNFTTAKEVGVSAVGKKKKRQSKLLFSTTMNRAK